LLVLLSLSLLQAGVSCDVVVDDKKEHNNDAKPALHGSDAVGTSSSGSVSWAFKRPISAVDTPCVCKINPFMTQ
jgi:hypothetical protein